ncbi:T9SS type A sorting domain-containing protein [Flexithrix dorotheae]|uniref:T9SS type A sorting domain-containing protein n=1 Tax=Flexithrix dorotheae TaxID=70993 RepID=UPI00036C7882|nr:T9SS type A sorting domain-containing protein [Flexithrix dorotheae]
MKNYLLIILQTFLLCHNTTFNSIFAQCTATSSGNWSSPSTWTSCGGGIPTSSDDVIIDGYTVSIGSGITAEANSISIQNASSTLNSAATSVLNVQNSFDLKNGPQTVNILGDINANTMTFTGGNHQFTVSNGGSVDITNDFDLGSATVNVNPGGVMNIGGDFNLSGSPNVTIDGGMYVSNTIDFPYEIYINGSGNVGAGALSCPGYLGDCTSLVNANLTLPVELYYFKGENLGNRNIIQWATIQEKNNDYFLLEKSTDGYSFKEIAKISGQGTSYQINKYEFTDVNPSEGQNYYRLKQVDLDKYFSYSEVINITQRPTLGFKTTIYPNPVNQDENLMINYFGNAPGTVAVQILDLSGKAVYFKQNLIEKGNNILEVDLSKLALRKGMYIINTNGISHQKVLID